MIISDEEKAKVRRALVHLIRAEIDHKCKGAAFPEDAPIIEHELRSARATFWSLFRKQENQE